MLLIGGMIATDNNNGGLLFTAEVKNILTESGKTLSEKQYAASLLYHRESGTLQDSLQRQAFTVTDSGDVQSLIFSYPKHIRAIDRQRSVWGKKKENYHPIYNRPLYGEIYRYTIPMVRSVIRRMYRQHRRNLKQIFSQPIEIQP